MVDTSIKNDFPTVSVIIIVFNGAKYIKNAIESVFNQTFKDFEIVVVDDGSTDNTKEVLEPWIMEGRIHYFYQENKGVSPAYNVGVRLSKGKYIKFLDCDDILYPAQLETQVNHLHEKSSFVISVTDYEFEFENKNRKSVKVRLDNERENQLLKFIENNQCPCHAILISRNLIKQAGGYDEELACYEDQDLWVRALLEGGIFEKINYVGCCYRIVRGSVSSDPDKMFRQRCKFYEKLNQKILPKIVQLHDKVLQGLLSVNTKNLHMCFARKVNPTFYLPATLQASRIIYALKKRGARKILVKIIGFKNIALLQYIKLCLTDKGYRKSLQEFRWREG